MVRIILMALVGLSVALLACGDDGGGTTPTAPAATATAAEPETPEAPTPAATATPVRPPTATTLTLVAPPEAAAGSQVTVAVRIDGVTNLGAYQFTPVIDDQGLRVISIQDGGFLSSTGRSPTCQPATTEQGAATYYCVTVGSQPAGPNGTGTLATITLQMLAAGAFEVSLGDVLVTTPDGTEAPVTAVGATITVR